jgi:hypothetical protein
MAGISDQAMGKLDSQNKFNGCTEDATNVEWLNNADQVLNGVGISKFNARNR